LAIERKEHHGDAYKHLYGDERWNVHSVDEPLPTGHIFSWKDTQESKNQMISKSSAEMGHNCWKKAYFRGWGQKIKGCTQGEEL
jgi:hypothetical protein